MQNIPHHHHHHRYHHPATARGGHTLEHRPIEILNAHGSSGLDSSPPDNLINTTQSMGSHPATGNVVENTVPLPPAREVFAEQYPATVSQAKPQIPIPSASTAVPAVTTPTATAAPTMPETRAPASSPAPITPHIPRMRFASTGSIQTTVSSAFSSSPSRKRNASAAGLQRTPSNDNDTEDTVGQGNATSAAKARQTSKRACNECRQQKLRCDAGQNPFASCSRCCRLNLACKIEPNFKRVEKRIRNSEMVTELDSLKRQVAHLSSLNAALLHGAPTSHVEANEDGLAAAAAASHPSPPAGSKSLENVVLSMEKAREIFQIFFVYYHPFLCFLDPGQFPEEVYAQSPLLFWTIIAVGSRRPSPNHLSPTGTSSLLTSLASPVLRLAWSTLADVPRGYNIHFVKALALLCTWPFPTSSTSTDPTFTLCGMMMNVAMQIGLHRPSHAQDFSKLEMVRDVGKLKERVMCWAICNCVAQRVSTGYGQPSLTLFDWSLSSFAAADPDYKLPPEVHARLEVEKLCNEVSKYLYGDKRDPVGLTDDAKRYLLSKVLAEKLADLEGRILPLGDEITTLYLRAARLHMHLSSFFDHTTARDYHEGLISLHLAATKFLEASLNLELPLSSTSDDAQLILGLRSANPNNPADPTISPEAALLYTTTYLYQMTLAAGFVLLKTCRSFFAAHIDVEYAKTLFQRTIWGLRHMSVSTNDLPQRMTEVLARMWKSTPYSNERASCAGASEQGHLQCPTRFDDSLQLKVKCRMSMSLVYDSVWRWRKDYLARGNSFDSFLKHPTRLDGNSNSSSEDSSICNVYNNNEEPADSSMTTMTSHNAQLPNAQTDPPVASPCLTPSVLLGNETAQQQQQQQQQRQSSHGFPIQQQQQQQHHQQPPEVPLPMPNPFVMDIPGGYEVFDTLNWVFDYPSGLSFNPFQVEGIGPAGGAGAAAAAGAGAGTAAELECAHHGGHGGEAGEAAAGGGGNGGGGDVYDVSSPNTFYR